MYYSQDTLLQNVLIDRTVFVVQPGKNISLIENFTKTVTISTSRCPDARQCRGLGIYRIQRVHQRQLHL